MNHPDFKMNLCLFTVTTFIIYTDIINGVHLCLGDRHEVLPAKIVLKSIANLTGGKTCDVIAQRETCS